MRTRRVITFVLTVFMLFSLASCRDIFASSHAKKEAVKYFEYLKNRDIDKLNSLFSDDVRDTHDLDKEWEEFFAGIDGNIVSYEGITSRGESERIDHGKTTYYDINIIYENVVTDTGKTYEWICFSQVRENKKHPENKGINLFAVKLPADNEDGYVEKLVGGFITYTD